MRKTKRSGLDRRSGRDRRRVHLLDYFLSGGIERRSWKERRSQNERRTDWVRVSDWTSVPMAVLEYSETPTNIGIL